MSEYRYFAAKDKGLTARALSTMEKAGSRVLGSLDVIDGFQKSVVPIAFTVDGDLRALSVIPNISSWTPQGKFFKEYVTRLLIENFLSNAQELSRDKRISVGTPNLYVSGRQFHVDQSVMLELERISDILPDLGLNPNLGVRIAEIGKQEGKPVAQDPARAVLTVGGQSFYPEARQIFSNWVIRAPQYVPLLGNDFVPPDSKEISSEELSKMMTSLPFDDFRHDHQKARRRILSIQKVEVQLGPM